MIRIPLRVALVFAAWAGLAQAKDYDFALEPAPALERLTQLKHLSNGPPTVAAAERALFEDSADGKLDRHTFAEAALIASGVVDADQRKVYLAKIERIEADARKAVGVAKSETGKGDQLLRFLHDGPMKAGYETAQSRIDVLLDTGKYNCVSSTVFYNIFAARLGLDARGILVSGHAFAVVRDGGNVLDVETTCKAGFNPRDPAILKEVEEKTGQKRSTDRQDRREVREPGLLAAIYANRGAELCERKKFYEALQVSFAALALDRSSDTGLQNAHAALTQWTKHLVEQKEFETCLAVVAVGRAMAPKDSALVSNRNACWQEWLKTVHEKDGEAAARQLAARITKDNAGDKDTRAVVRDHVIREMNRLQEARQFEPALAYLGRNRALLPDASDVPEMQAFCWQEWIKATEGEEPARKLIVRLLQENGGEKRLQDVARNHVVRGLNALKNAKKYEDALAFVARHREVLRDAKEMRELDIVVYDAWAMSHAPTKHWAAAIAVYQRALEKYPGDSHLLNNLKYCEQQSKK